jgi:hypothetical protein
MGLHRLPLPVALPPQVPPLEPAPVVIGALGPGADEQLARLRHLGGPPEQGRRPRLREVEVAAHLPLAVEGLALALALPLLRLPLVRSLLGAQLLRAPVEGLVEVGQEPGRGAHHPEDGEQADGQEGRRPGPPPRPFEAPLPGPGRPGPDRFPV